MTVIIGPKSEGFHQNMPVSEVAANSLRHEKMSLK